MNKNYLYLSTLNIAIRLCFYTLCCGMTPVRIKISKGFAEAPIFGDTTDVKGKFTLYYPADYKGVGTIEIYKGAEIQIILNGKDVEFTAPNAKSISEFSFSNDQENELFKNYLNTEMIWLTTVVQTENYKPADKDYALAQELRTKSITNIEQILNNVPESFYITLMFLKALISTVMLFKAVLAVKIL